MGRDSLKTVEEIENKYLETGEITHAEKCLLGDVYNTVWYRAEEILEKRKRMKDRAEKIKNVKGFIEFVCLYPEYPKFMKALIFIGFAFIIGILLGISAIIPQPFGFILGLPSLLTGVVGLCALMWASDD